MPGGGLEGGLGRGGGGLGDSGALPRVLSRVLGRGPGAWGLGLRVFQLQGLQCQTIKQYKEYRAQHHGAILPRSSKLCKAFANELCFIVG